MVTLKKKDKQFLKDCFYIYKLQEAQEVKEDDGRARVRWNKKRIKKNMGRLKDQFEWTINPPYKKSTRPVKLSRSWREQVLMRHGHICQICDSRVSLHAHHIESYADNEPLRWDVDNGACLCKKCHDLFHDQFGWGRNNEAQWVVFYSNEKL